jgi:hypothetical protein
MQGENSYSGKGILKTHDLILSISIQEGKIQLYGGKKDGRNIFSPFYYDDLTFYVIDILLKFYCICNVIVIFPLFILQMVRFNYKQSAGGVSFDRNFDTPNSCKENVGTSEGSYLFRNN